MNNATTISGAKLEAGSERTFVLGGDARFTLVSNKTGARFTYRVEASEPTDGRDLVWFVSVLTGSDNTNDYSYLGIIKSAVIDGTRVGTSFFRTAKSKIAADAPSHIAFKFFWERSNRVPAALEVWHSNHCSRCGRLLTTPESIRTGIGPVCSERRGAA